MDKVISVRMPYEWTAARVLRRWVFFGVPFLLVRIPRTVMGGIGFSYALVLADSRIAVYVTAVPLRNYCFTHMYLRHDCDSKHVLDAWREFAADSDSGIHRMPMCI